MATEDKSIKRRRGTEAALKATGQLIDGQAGFCSDKKKILFKRPATWTRPGEFDEYDIDGLQTQITTEADAIAAHADLLTGMHGLPALDHFVYGDTAYGGTIVDNLNTLARTMLFTCFGTAVGAPDTAHSWFGWHINSNAGVVSASQIAIAFGTDLIVKYRTKTASVWGPWRNGSTIVNNSTDAAYTFLASDSNTCHIVNTSAATTRTVPSDTTAPDIAIGDSIEVQNLGTGVVTFVEASGVTIRSSLTLVMHGQYSVCMLRKIAANTWVLTGERTAV